MLVRMTRALRRSLPRAERSTIDRDEASAHFRLRLVAYEDGLVLELVMREGETCASPRRG